MILAEQGKARLRVLFSTNIRLLQHIDVMQVRRIHDLYSHPHAQGTEHLFLENKGHYVMKSG